MATAKKKKLNLVEFTYGVVLWKDGGNTLVEKKKVKVKRATERSARDWMIKKYPRPYFFELDSKKNVSL